MHKHYGPDKGERVFRASINKGTVRHDHACPLCNKIDLAADSMAKASTPRPLGTHMLWHKPGFHLPPYIQHVASHFVGKMGLSRAIAMAVGIIKNWAHGHPSGGEKTVHPDTVAAATKALAEWTALKARAKSVPSVKGLADAMDQVDSVVDLAGYKASQKRAPAGGAGGGQWTAQGGAAPATPKNTQGVSPALRAWAQKQIGHYPANVNTAALRKKWDNWFRFLTMTPQQQKFITGHAPKKPQKRPKTPPISQLPWLLAHTDADAVIDLIRDRGGLRTMDLAVTSGKVHALLAKSYPPKVLDWVHRGDWSLDRHLPLAKIDLARRPGGRDPAKVEAIRQSIRAGKKLAPIVVVKADDGTHDIADGYHRALAYQKERKGTIPALVGTGLPESGPWQRRMHAAKLNLAGGAVPFVDLAVRTAGGAGATGIHVGPHHWKHGWVPLTPDAWASHLKKIRGWHAPRVRRADHMGHLQRAHAEAGMKHHEAFVGARGRQGIATVPSKGGDEQLAHLKERHGLVGQGLEKLSPTQREKLHGAEHGLRPATARTRTPGAVRTPAQRAGLRTGQGLHEGSPDVFRPLSTDPAIRAARRDRAARLAGQPHAISNGDVQGHLREQHGMAGVTAHTDRTLLVAHKQVHAEGQGHRTRPDHTHVAALEKTGAGLAVHLRDVHGDSMRGVGMGNLRAEALHRHRLEHGLTEPWGQTKAERKARDEGPGTATRNANVKRNQEAQARVNAAARKKNAEAELRQAAREITPGSTPAHNAEFWSGGGPRLKEPVAHPRIADDFQARQHLAGEHGLNPSQAAQVKNAKRVHDLVHEDMNAPAGKAGSTHLHEVSGVQTRQREDAQAQGKKWARGNDVLQHMRYQHPKEHLAFGSAKTEHDATWLEVNHRLLHEQGNAPSHPVESRARVPLQKRKPTIDVRDHINNVRRGGIGSNESARERFHVQEMAPERVRLHMAAKHGRAHSSGTDAALLRKHAEDHGQQARPRSQAALREHMKLHHEDKSGWADKAATIQVKEQHNRDHAVGMAAPGGERQRPLSHWHALGVAPRGKAESGVMAKGDMPSGSRRGHVYKEAKHREIARKLTGGGGEKGHVERIAAGHGAGVRGVRGRGRVTIAARIQEHMKAFHDRSVLAIKAEQLHAEAHGIGKTPGAVEQSKLNRAIAHLQQKHGFGTQSAAIAAAHGRVHAQDHERFGFANARRQGRNPVNHGHVAGDTRTVTWKPQRARAAPQGRAGKVRPSQRMGKGSERARHISEINKGDVGMHRAQFGWKQAQRMQNHLAVRHGVENAPRMKEDLRRLHDREHGIEPPKAESRTAHMENPEHRFMNGQALRRHVREVHALKPERRNWNLQDQHREDHRNDPRAIEAERKQAEKRAVQHRQTVVERGVSAPMRHVQIHAERQDNARHLEREHNMPNIAAGTAADRAHAKDHGVPLRGEKGFAKMQKEMKAKKAQDNADIRRRHIDDRQFAAQGHVDRRAVGDVRAHLQDEHRLVLRANAGQRALQQKHAAEHGAKTPQLPKPMKLVKDVPKEFKGRAVGDSPKHTAEAIANGTDPGQKEFEKTVDDAIASGEAGRKRAGVGGIDGTRLITFGNGAKYIARDSNANNWGARGFGGDLGALENERLANDLGRAMGLHLSRITIRDLNGERVALQEVLPAKDQYNQETHQHHLKTEEGKRIVHFDRVVENFDRSEPGFWGGGDQTGHNIMNANGHPVAVDNGGAFSGQRSAYSRNKVGPATAADKAQYNAAIDAFAERLQANGVPLDRLKRNVAALP